jgi:proteasome lid subunit RPN8/RPN11
VLAENTQLQLAPALEKFLAAKADRARSATGELCGLLLGHGLHASEAVSIPNLASAPDRFCFEPAAHRRALLRATAAGLAVVATWHTHRAAAFPSAADLAGHLAHPRAALVLVCVKAAENGSPAALSAWSPAGAPIPLRLGRAPDGEAQATAASPAIGDRP